MLDTIFFSIIFFILDHIYLLLAGSLISLMAMKFCYRIWKDQLRAPDARYLSLIMLILSAILLLLFFIGVIYVIAVIIAFLPDLRKVLGK
jgi:prolipoprotein diacylglyceryltransferase